MTTYTPVTKNSTSYTATSRFGGTLISPGMPIGLLLALTYSTVAGLTTYTAVSKNNTTYTALTKN